LLNFQLLRAGFMNVEQTTVQKENPQNALRGEKVAWRKQLKFTVQAGQANIYLEMVNFS
jgi:hypothetical protein